MRRILLVLLLSQVPAAAQVVVGRIVPALPAPTIPVGAPRLVLPASASLPQPLRAPLPALPSLGAPRAMAGVPALRGVPVAAAAAVHRPERLRAVFDRVDAARAAGETPVVLFDIDDTLVSAAYRHLRILREFAARPEVRLLYPEFARRAGAATAADMRYLFAETVRAFGLDASLGVAAAEAFWFARFFEDDYIREDRPLPGAAEYVRALERRGAVVVYLTARVEERRAVSMEKLDADGFPVPDGERVVLMLKPDKDADTGEYKRDALRRVAAMGRVVAGYENEPRNANIFKEGFPGAEVFLLDTRRPPDGPPPRPDLVWVLDFVLP